MRITILANQDIASNLAINHLIDALPDHQLNVLLSERVGGNKPRPQPLNELAFFEQTLFNQIVFPALGDSRPQKPGRLKSFDEINGAGIDVKRVNSINDKSGLDTLAIYKPHLILSVRFGFILKTDAINIPEYGVLNLHSGVLPDYRGVMATFWAMHNRDAEIGTTLHYIQDAGIDSGDILSVQTHPVNYQHSYLWNVLSLYKPGIDAMVSAVKQIDTGKTPQTQSQDIKKGNYYSFPDYSVLSDFSSQGLTLFSHDEIVQFAQDYL